MTDMVELIKRAARDPEFLSGVASGEELKAAFNMRDSSERKIVETLRARIAHVNGKI